MRNFLSRIVVAIISIIICIPAKGQLKMAQVPEKTKTQIIVPYDSLTNIVSIGGIRAFEKNYDHLIGQTISLISATNCSGFVCYSYDTNQDVDFRSIINKPLIVKKIDSAEWYFQDAEDSTKTIKIVFNSRLWDEYLNLDFVCHGYYEKIKQLYLNQELVYVNQDNDGDLSDIIKSRFMDYDTKSNLQRKIPANTIWKCTDVLILPGKLYSSDAILNVDRVILNVENEKFGKYYLYASEILKRDNTNLDYFMTLPEFSRFTAYNNQLKAEAKAKAAAAAKEAERRREEHRKSIIARYGDHLGYAILQGKVLIGMSKSACMEAWGNPQSINRTTNIYGVREQWVYPGNKYLYFEDGILTTIQD